MNALIDMLQNDGILLGFVSVEIKYAYLGSLFVTLLCVIYGLITWNTGRKAARRRRTARTVRVKPKRTSRRRPAKTIRVKPKRTSRRKPVKTVRVKKRRPSRRRRQR